MCMYMHANTAERLRLHKAVILLLIISILLSRHGVVVGEYETIFNTKYFIIICKITALHSRNRSALLTYIHTYVTLLESGVKMVHTGLHTPTPTLDCVHDTHASLGASLFQDVFLAYAHK